MKENHRLNATLIFLITLLCYAWVFPRWADPNQNSRLNMVVAVVDDGTFQIDRYVANTVDYAKVGDHYYSDKAPGAAFLGIPIYAALGVLLDTSLLQSFTERLAQSDAFAGTLDEDGSGMSTDKVRFAIAQVVLSLLVSAVPTALLCALLYVVLVRMTGFTAAAVVAALAYGLLSPALPYANAFYGHQLAAALLFAAFALIYLAPARIGAGRLLLLGLFLGYSVVSEYPVALMVVPLFLYALYALVQRRQALQLVWVAGSGLVVAALWMGYNTVVFGAPLELGYSHSELWLDQHDTGFMSLGMPTLDAVWGITFSPFRGLFLLAPWLLLAMPGYVIWWRSSTPARQRVEVTVSLVCVGLMFLFNSASGMWWGGFAVGPRYLLPMLPFMVLPCAFVFARHGMALWFRIVLGLLFVWSGLALWSQTLAAQAFPSDASRNPWLSHVLPAWREGNLARNMGTVLGLEGLMSYVPLLALCVALAAIWYGVARHNGRSSMQVDTGTSDFMKQSTTGDKQHAA